MRKLLLAAAGLVAMASTNASAQSILTQNIVFGPSFTDVTRLGGLTTNGVVAPFFFFDTRVGTLNSITFTKSYQFSSQITLSNTSASASSGTVFTESAAQFSSDDGAVTEAFNRALNTAGSFSVAGSTLAPVAFDQRGNTQSYSLAPGVSTLVNSSGMSSMTFTDSNAADLAAFSRLGTFSYNPFISTLTGSVVSNSGGTTSATPTTSFIGALTISYNITPFVTGGDAGAVPEPATWAMMMLGFGLAGGAMRRRRGSPRVFHAA